MRQPVDTNVLAELEKRRDRILIRYNTKLPGDGEATLNIIKTRENRLAARRRKQGVCRGSDTPTIYVGDIDMYIPLEKPNT